MKSRPAIASRISSSRCTDSSICHKRFRILVRFLSQVGRCASEGIRHPSHTTHDPIPTTPPRLHIIPQAAHTTRLQAHTILRPVHTIHLQAHTILQPVHTARLQALTILPSTSQLMVCQHIAIPPSQQQRHLHCRVLPPPILPKPLLMHTIQLKLLQSHTMQPLDLTILPWIIQLMLHRLQVTARHQLLPPQHTPHLGVRTTRLVV